MASEPRPRLTVQEYLELERQAETKNDFLNGEMFAMGGASLDHSLIVSNIVSAVRPQLRGRGCTIHSNDLRVRTPTDLFTYPDVVIVCGPRQLGDSYRDTLLNPILIVEVLSNSTEAYDRVTKLKHYQTIPALSEVLFVAQDRCRVEHWFRSLGRWASEERTDLGQTLELTSIGCRLALSEVYEDVAGV